MQRDTMVDLSGVLTVMSVVRDKDDKAMPAGFELLVVRRQQQRRLSLSRTGCGWLTSVDPR
jgi:hypothetical protein